MVRRPLTRSSSQTSGASNLGDNPITKLHHHPPGRVFSDKENIYQYMLEREAAEPYAQRTSDLTVVQTGKATGVKTFIIMFPRVYGCGMGLFNTRSIQGPALIKAALDAGHAVYIGDGKAEWGHTHIENLAALYEVVVAKLLAGEDIPSGERGIYFAATGQHTWRQFAEASGRAGHELGALRTPEAVSVSIDEFADKWTGGNKQLAELGFASR
jgi:nucleoside-diphosphate-sugar epimerase